MVQILPAYKNERIVTLLKDGIWCLIPSVLFGALISAPAVLFHGTSSLTFMALAAPAFFGAFLVAFFTPLIAAYALVNQDHKSKWTSFFDTNTVRKIWRSLGPMSRSNYKKAIISSLGAFFVTFLGKCNSNTHFYGNSL